MENQKIINLLDKIDSDSKHFAYQDLLTIYQKEFTIINVLIVVLVLIILKLWQNVKMKR